MAFLTHREGIRRPSWRCAPVRRLVQRCREAGTAVDATQGRKTKAVLVMENSQLILSALLPETICARAQLPEAEEAEEKERE